MLKATWGTKLRSNGYHVPLLLALSSWTDAPDSWNLEAAFTRSVQSSMLLVFLSQCHGMMAQATANQFWFKF